MPLSAHMGVRVVALASQGVTVEAPLEPNVNERTTAFGGSVATLAILAGWGLVHARLSAEVPEAYTVIRSASVEYLKPIRGASFSAVAEAIEQADWARFRKTLAKRGLARLRVAVSVLDGDDVAATFSGAYVALVDGSPTA